VYLDGVIRRLRTLLAFLIDSIKTMRTSDLQYRIQQSAPMLLRELDSAHALKESM